MAVSTFVSDYWNQRPLMVRGGAKRFLKLFDVERFLALSSSESAKLTCSFPDPDNRRAEAHRRRPVLKITPDQLGPVLAAGATVTLTDLQAMDDRIARLAADVQQTLSFIGAIRCFAWLSPAQTGIPIHFDGTPTITMQISGAKTWRVSQRPALQWPPGLGLRRRDGSVTYHGQQEGQLARREPWAHAVEDMPVDQFEVHALQPGDILYIPAGTWHTTEARGSDSSLGVNLHFRPAKPLDLLTNALEQRLIQDPAWRHLPVAPAPGGRKAPNEVRAFLRARIKELQRALAEVEQEDSWIEETLRAGAPFRSM